MLCHTFATSLITSDKKLRLINGLNGGLLTGVNGVNPVLMGGLNTPLLPGGPAVLGQPPLTQVGPAAALPSYMLQPLPVGGVPFGLPNIGPQLTSPYFPPNVGLPYYLGGPPNQPIFPQQQQVGAGQNPGNTQVAPPGPLNRFKRSFLRRTTARPPVSVTQMSAPVNPTLPRNTFG
ncbi:secretory calcium-binding phosphoprotein 9 precursor [Triplophysa rosa]|uniref:Secretory calcium-binding phosphoprotein 9 n=1 Tax=Triplophysa rosa TaxID=992332 RepID=A0A9W8C8S9_TRIRA|nr:secretory calcium-binding phosphoprotein 9 precursor [Triplophysa rosa]